MMRYFKYFLVGFLFGFAMYKVEAVSFFRVFEMFHFHSFHMFGLLFTGVFLATIITQAFDKGLLKTIKGQEWHINPKAPQWKRYILGGIIFGIGWALTGVCSGMMFVLLGAGYTVFLVFVAAAMTGTYVYGLLRPKLPH